MKKRVLSWILAFVMIVGLFPLLSINVSAITENEVTQKLNAWQSKLDQKYWNYFDRQIYNGNQSYVAAQLKSIADNGVLDRSSASNADIGVTNTACAGSVYESGCRSNCFPEGWWQCQGFANWLGYALFGSTRFDSTKWTTYSGNALDSITLKPGDHIYTPGHSAIVWKISGDSFYTVEAWGSSGCKISYSPGFNWNQYSKISSMLSALKANGGSVFRCKQVEVPIHTCNKGTYLFYEADHPHYNCYRCSICGETWRDTTSSNHVTSCALCAPSTYTISFNANGGTGAPASQTKTQGTALALSSTKPTRTGYTFKGWATSSTATTATYSAGGSYTTDAAVILYAVWKANTYTVKYDANGGSGSMSSSTHTYNTSKALTANAFTRSGYTFLGWSKTSTATTATYTDKQSVKNLTTTANGTVTLYAVWKENEYAVNGSCGANVQWQYSTDTGLLEIWGNGAMTDFVDVPPWCHLIPSIKSVVIYEGVTSIGSDAFNGCVNMVSVYLPDTMNSIGDMAFAGCKKLKEFRMPGIEYVDAYLGILALPSNVTHIGLAAFTACTGIWKAELPDNLTRIEDMAFLNCSNLQYVCLPYYLSSIGESAFENCNSIQGVLYGGVECVLKGITIEDGNEPIINADIYALSGEHGLIVSRDAKEATCTTDGWGAYRFCKYCGQLFTASDPMTEITSAAIIIPATGHTFSSSWSKDANYHWHAATCEHTSEVSDKAQHTWDSGKITTSATHTETGVKTYTCTACKQTKTETIAKLGTHTFTEQKATDAYKANAATCTEAAKYYYSCECGEKGTETFTSSKALGHSYKDGTCTRCGAVDPDFNPTAAKITADTVRGTAGKTVKVTVKAENNPGVVSMTLKVEYDSSVLTLVGVTDKGLIPNAMHTTKYASPYTLTWENDTAASNFTEDGALVELIFEIAEDAEPGEYPIRIGTVQDGIYNFDADNIDFAMINGAVIVSTVLPGDVNGDGVVTNKDRLLLSRYLANWEGYDESDIDMLAADVNCDGAVTNKDRLILSRYLANWAGYETLPMT